MTYRATVRNGTIEINDGVRLPEGTALRVEVEEAPPVRKLSLAERAAMVDVEKMKRGMRKFCGAIEGPEDMAENHDKYAHGKLD